MRKIIINSFILILFVTTPLHAFDEIRLVCKWRDTLMDYSITRIGDPGVEINGENYITDPPKEYIEKSQNLSLYHDFKISINQTGCFFNGHNLISKHWGKQGQLRIKDDELICTFQEESKADFQFSDNLYLRNFIKIKKIEVDRYTGRATSFSSENREGTTDKSIWLNHQYSSMLAMWHDCKKEVKQF